MKIAHLVKNPCNPDWRVIKAAEQNAKIKGSKVQVFATQDNYSLPNETVNNVTYERLYQKFRFNTPLRKRDLEKNIFIDIFYMIILGLEVAMQKLKLIEFASPRYLSTVRAKRGCRKLFFENVLNFAPDVIHCHDLETLQTGVMIKKKIGCKVIYDAHEFELDKNPPAGPLTKILVKRHEGKNIKFADCVVTVSEEIADDLHEIYNLPEKPLVIYNVPSKPLREKMKTYNLSFFNERAAANTKISFGNLTLNNILFKRQELFSNIMSNFLNVGKEQVDNFNQIVTKRNQGPKFTDLFRFKKIGIHIGLVTVGRGIETCVKALAMMEDHALIVIGPRNNPAFLNNLINLCGSYGVRNRVFILNPLEEGLVNFIGYFDYSLVTTIPNSKSSDYSMPNKLFESALAGIPILCADTLSASKFVEKYQVGATFISDNHYDLAAKINSLCDGKLKNIKKISPKELKNFTIKNQYQELNKYIQSLSPNS